MLEQYCLNYGYSLETINKMRASYALHYYKDGLLLSKIESINSFLLDYGLTRDQVLQVTSNYISIYSFSVEYLKDKLDYFLSLGYSKKEIIKIIKSLKQFFSYKNSSITTKINDLIALGFKEQDIKSIILLFPAVLCLNIETIKEKISIIESFDYTHEEVILMITKLPAILGYSIENIKDKIEFYNSIGLHRLPFVDPKQLMQSVKLSHVRFIFFKNRGITIGGSNYKILFYDQKYFKSHYGKTNKQLLEELEDKKEATL